MGWTDKDLALIRLIAGADAKGFLTYPSSLMKKVKTVHDLWCKAYTDLSVAHARIEKEVPNPIGLREHLFGKYFRGELNPDKLVKEEREKMVAGQMCRYCEKPFPSGKGLQQEHILPTSRGGLDQGDNVIFVCRSCNGSEGKGNKDFIAWALSSDLGFPPIVLIRHYLKLVWEHCERHGLLEMELEKAKELPSKEVPFDWDSLKLGSSARPYPDNVSLRGWAPK